jgi:hypothetical protein
MPERPELLTHKPRSPLLATRRDHLDTVIGFKTFLIRTAGTGSGELLAIVSLKSTCSLGVGRTKRSDISQAWAFVAEADCGIP